MRRASGVRPFEPAEAVAGQGAPRPGQALPQGIVICGRCGRGRPAGAAPRRPQTLAESARQGEPAPLARPGGVAPRGDRARLPAGGCPEDGRYDLVWPEDCLQHVLTAEDVDILFLSGCASNQATLCAQFDRIIPLSAPTPHQDRWAVPAGSPAAVPYPACRQREHPRVMGPRTAHGSALGAWSARSSVDNSSSRRRPNLPNSTRRRSREADGLRREPTVRRRGSRWWRRRRSRSARRRCASGRAPRSPRCATRRGAHHQQART